MAVKKATSAARRSVPSKKAAPAKAGARKATTKARTTKVTAPKTASRSSSAKSTSVTPGTAKARATKVAATKPAKRAGPTKVAATKPAKRAAATKVAATKPAKRAAATKVAATKPAKRAPATKAATTRSAARVSPTRAARKADGQAARGTGSTGAGAQQQRLRVRENEKPWTAKELATVRAELESDVARLQNEILVAEFDLAGLMRDIGDGAGDDPADAGTATFEREQEISLANNARGVFEQSARALARLLDGSYGVCESCGSPIGKNRLLAFPRATLCMTCKSKQERR
jgi:RNA polymerase-binding transcription factor DksA